MPNPTPTPAPALAELLDEIERRRADAQEAANDREGSGTEGPWQAEADFYAAITAALAQGEADAALVGGSDTIGVLGEVAAERARQDAQWGGPAHDDEHASWEWRDYRTKYEVRIDLEVDEYDDPADPARVRDALVKIAALAVAQIESLDRTALSTARTGEASHEPV